MFQWAWPCLVWPQTRLTFVLHLFLLHLHFYSRWITNKIFLLLACLTEWIKVWIWRESRLEKERFETCWLSICWAISAGYSTGYFWLKHWYKSHTNLDSLIFFNRAESWICKFYMKSGYIGIWRRKRWQAIAVSLHQGGHDVSAVCNRVWSQVTRARKGTKPTNWSHCWIRWHANVRNGFSDGSPFNKIGI